MRKFNFSNKRAQIGDTLTWIVAMVILLIILVVFIFLSGAVRLKVGQTQNELINGEYSRKDIGVLYNLEYIYSSGSFNEPRKLSEACESGEVNSGSLSVAMDLRSIESSYFSLPRTATLVYSDGNELKYIKYSRSIEC